MGSILYNNRKKCTITPLFMHIELTQRCPLRCPQCYCSLEGTDLKWEMFLRIVDSAKEIGVQAILLTGGEPLVYPKICDAVKYINDQGIGSMISSSGVGLTLDMAKSLFNNGLNRFYVSLNGSNSEIHNLSRSGFKEAIKAIKTIKKTNNWCGVNWVARKDNHNDFNELVQLSKEMRIDRIDVLSSKYSSDGEIQSLSLDELIELADNIKTLPRNYISIELCYSQLQEIVYGMKIHEIFKYCVAGKFFINVYADGTFSPCRHTNIKHKCSSLKEYWHNSIELKKIRDKYDKPSCSGMGLSISNEII